MQKRLISLILIGFLTIFVATAAFAQQPATGKVIKWRFQSHWPAGSASFKPLKDFFDQKLTKLTDGRLQITLYPAAALVPTKELFDSCRQGTVDGGTGSPAYWMTIIPLAAVSGNCPMTFREPWEGLYFHYVLGFEDMLKEAHAKHNILYYTEKIYPTAMIGKKPIRKIEDFKGYKIRSSGAIATMLKELGAAPSLIPGEELYLALQTGVVEGAHWGAAGGALTMKFCEVAKYYIQPNLAMSGTDVIIINKDAFNALPKDLQVTLDLALKERVWHRTHEYIMDEINALETMKKNFKVTVSTLPPEDQKKMMKVAVKQWDTVAAKDPGAAKAVGMLKDFLRKLDYLD
ncbi:MAG: TRAP transporter substrate-binding protein DctP [Deltaproteobacteria bacterium]|nr:TRAP transporter substrate-binding protein DctP [Deltaproteobacteria bacterium]